MKESTPEPSNPLEPAPEIEGETDMPKSETIAGNVETNDGENDANETKPETSEEKVKRLEQEALSDEMRGEIHRLLKNTNRGRGLMVRLDAIARPDLYKTTSQVNWVRELQLIEIRVRPNDLSPGIFEQFRAYCWDNCMSYCFTDAGGASVLVVRWNLPDVLPLTHPEIQRHAMAAPEKHKPKKPEVKEVK